jgi:hypothetical protein
MFMGTKDIMLEVPCPNVSMPSSKVGWSTELAYLNGGASVRRSTAASKRYEMTWNSVTRDEARTVLDLADRLYGPGDIYWLDPFVADKNMLPQHWASPMQGLYDGLPLIGDNRPVPTLGLTNNGFPINGVTYDIAEGDVSRKVWVPIPAGYSAHVGVYGENGSGGKIFATPTYNSNSSDTPQELTLMEANNTARANLVISAEDGYNGVELSLGGEGTISLLGMMVQVLKDGKTPTPGGFISGQGHSGCQFVAQPEYTPYSAAFDTVGMVASLVETGAWDS